MSNLEINLSNFNWYDFVIHGPNPKPKLNIENIFLPENNIQLLIPNQNTRRLYDHFQRTLLYSLTNYTPYTTYGSVSALTICDPEESSPPGVILRFMALINNPGYSLCQVELRLKDNEYYFWVHSSKEGEICFHEAYWEFTQLIYLLFQIVRKMTIVSVTPNSINNNKRLQSSFDMFTTTHNIVEFQPHNWDHFEALLHHVLYLSASVPRSYFSIYGWSLHWKDGDYLYLNQVEYYCSIRGAVAPFLDGTLHTRNCPTIHCVYCIQSCFPRNISSDIINIITEYGGIQFNK